MTSLFGTFGRKWRQHVRCNYFAVFELAFQLGLFLVDFFSQSVPFVFKPSFHLQIKGFNLVKTAAQMSTVQVKNIRFHDVTASLQTGGIQGRRRFAAARLSLPVPVAPSCAVRRRRHLVTSSSDVASVEFVDAFLEAVAAWGAHARFSASENNKNKQ